MKRPTKLLNSFEDDINFVQHCLSNKQGDQRYLNCLKYSWIFSLKN